MLRVVGNAYREAYSGIRRPVWLLAAVSLVNRAGTMVLPFLALYLTTQRGFTVAAAGRAVALYGAGGVAGSYLGSWLCDRLPPRQVMAGSLLLGGGGFLLLGAVEQRTAILAMIFGLSLTFEAFRPANNVAIAAASAPGRIAQSLALYRLAINLGMTIGPAAGGLLAARGYSWLFWVDGATSIAAAALLLVCSRGSGQGTYLAVSSGVSGVAGVPGVPGLPGVPGMAEVVEPAAKPPRPGPGPRRALLGDGSFLALLLLTLLLSTVFMQTFGAWTLALHDQYRFSEAQVGAVFAISTLIIVVFEMLLVRALAGRDLLRVVGLGSFLFCLGLALLPLGASFGFVVGTVFVSTLGEMLTMPLLGAVFAGWGPPAVRDQALGLFSFVVALGFVLAPLCGTWIYEHWGPARLWYGCGVAGLVLWAGFAGLAAVWRRRQAAAAAAADAAPQPSLASLR
jgi:predicted MFS family arabinose efflux permease